MKEIILTYKCKKCGETFSLDIEDLHHFANEKVSYDYHCLTCGNLIMNLDYIKIFNGKELICKIMI